MPPLISQTLNPNPEAFLGPLSLVIPKPETPVPLGSGAERGFREMWTLGLGVV